MAKVNLRKAASYVAKENKGDIDISVAQATEAIGDFMDYLLENHKYSEILAKFEERKEDW